MYLWDPRRSTSDNIIIPLPSHGSELVLGSFPHSPWVPFNCFSLVCVQVMDAVYAGMSKEDSRDIPAIEKAIGEYCAQDTLNARQKKICYYIDPIKRAVAHPFSLGMGSLKLCQRITKQNPEICSVKMPIKTDKMEPQDLSKLRVKQLKQILSDRGVECTGCLEKAEFIKKVEETAHLASDEF